MTLLAARILLESPVLHMIDVLGSSLVSLSLIFFALSGVNLFVRATQKCVTGVCTARATRSRNFVSNAFLQKTHL